MKQKFLGLRTIIYKVSDLEEATKWYAKVFEIQPYFREGFYVGFNVGGYELGLLPENVSAEKTDNVLQYWGVDDVDNMFLHLLNNGATMHEKPNSVGGEIVVASVKDPWNNVIGIIYNPEFKIE